MRISGRFAVATMIALACVAAPCAAQPPDPGGRLDDSFRPAQAPGRFLRYPRAALVSRREGWVELSFIVSADGEVLEPMIENSNGNELFERAALEAIEDWDWEPALSNGKPIAQAIVGYRMTFSFEDLQTGARASFVRKLRHISELIEAGQQHDAATLLEELKYSDRQTLYEDAWLWWLNANYFQRFEPSNTQDIMQSLQRAMSGGAGSISVAYLPSDQFLAAADMLYRLAVNNRDYAEASRVFDHIVNFKHAQAAARHSAVVAELAPTQDRIESLIASDAVLELPGEIGTNGYWVHSLLRRSFQIAHVAGTLDNVDVRCRNGNARVPFGSTMDIWTVPDSWETCALYLKGRAGTTFELRDLPAAQAGSDGKDSDLLSVESAP